MTRLHAAAWKKDELELANWAGGRRHASNGAVNEDLSGPWWTAEHKTFTALPARLIKAFDQAKLNFTNHPDKTPFVMFTIHFKRGIPKRRFVALEVDIRYNDFEQVGRELEQVVEAEHIKAVAP